MDGADQVCDKALKEDQAAQRRLMPTASPSQKWTAEKWTTYLAKLKKEVEAGEAPVELYFQGMQILSSIQNPKWVRLPPLTEQHAGTICNQQAYISKGMMHQWSMKEWQWIFRSASELKDPGPWLNKIADLLAPKTTPVPSVTKGLKNIDRQRHFIAVKDAWGEHVRKVEELMKEANALNSFSR